MRLVALLVLLASSAALGDPLIGDAAPALELPSLPDGAKVAYRPGHVTLVDFSATWCGPCHAALEALTAIVARAPGVDLVIVDVGEPAATVARFYAARTLPPGTKVLVDADGVVAARWGHRRFPTTFLVDKGGTIRFINRGYGGGYPARIEQRVRGLLR